LAVGLRYQKLKRPRLLNFMAEVVPDLQQEFWRSPSSLTPIVEIPSSLPTICRAEVCAGCGSEFMISAMFCHSCGLSRPVLVTAGTSVQVVSGVWARTLASISAASGSMSAAWQKISFPRWLRYLHFHEIKNWVGLPTGALVAFFIGLGCMAGAITVSVIYKASNLAEFQAIQMWRIEWLLAATAAFLAGILLKSPPDDGE
jgi:hypothetical protein